MKKLVLSQFFVLIVGTLLAWTVFVMELISWIQSKDCSVGCAVNAVNPFFTPCFGGAIFFAAALGLSIGMLMKSKKK